MNLSVLPAEEAWPCRSVLRSRTTAEGGRDVGSTLPGAGFCAPTPPDTLSCRAKDRAHGGVTRPASTNRFMAPMRAQCLSRAFLDFEAEEIDSQSVYDFAIVCRSQ